MTKDKSKKTKDKKNGGFTLLEITISVAIIILVGALSLVSWVNSRRVRDLASAGQAALSVLRTAQTNAATGADASQWGVHLEQYRIVLFRGASYAGATALTPYPLPATVEIVNIALAGGGQDVIFKRITGGTDQSGTLLARVAGSATQTFPVSVDPSGAAYQTGTAPVPAGTRIIDARHRAFALGWSIKNSATMTLTFNDGEMIDPVAMAGYFNGDKSVFDWSGTVAVGGQNQVTRVHTTSLTDAGTTLSIDRDCRRNTKKLNVAIDGKDIATYQADCKAVAPGAFGGTMSEP